MPTEQDILHNLRNFYAAWVAWVNDQAPKVQPFNRDEGLCQSVANYAYHEKLGGTMAIKMKEYMKMDFQNEGYDRVYPFGETDWNHRYNTDTMHLCPRRLAFCVKMSQRNV